MSLIRLAAAAAVALCAWAGVALAQTPQPAPRTNLDAKPGTLSDKLSGTDGVIKPTGDVDPEMQSRAPASGTMPVIKPGSVPEQSGKGGLR